MSGMSSKGKALSRISIIQQDTSIYASIQCEANTQVLDYHEVKRDFDNSDSYKAYLLQDEVAEFVGEANDKIAEIAEGEVSPCEVRRKIAELRDGEVEIKVSRDKMEVKAIVFTPYGGNAITVDDMKRECQKAGVRFGLKRSRVESLLVKAMNAEHGSAVEGTIALGKPAKNGKNAFFKPLVELFSEKLRKPAELEDGKIDVRDLGEIETVKPGERIYQKIPLTAGVDGRNVLGEVLKAVPGKDAKLETSSGTIIDPNDENVLLAKREGLARLIENRMEVDDVYTLTELTPKQGHVKFNGSVVIIGDVSPEMKILASGDVIIGGYVESAIIRCKGELTVISGVSGKPLDEPTGGRQYNCLLESGNRINVAFANQVDIIAKRDVFINKQISYCNVSGSGLVVGQGANPNGKLIGGRYFLSNYLIAGHVGAPSDAETFISMNRTYDVFKQKEAHFWSQVELLQEKLEGWNTKLSGLMKEDQKNAVKFEIAQLENIIAKTMNYRKTLIERRREFMAGIEIKVNHTLFGGLSFQFGGKTLINEAVKGPSIVRLDEYQIVIEPKM